MEPVSCAVCVRRDVYKRQVADRAAGLDNGSHAGAAGTLDVVAKGEEGIGTQADTGNMAQVLFLFLRGQGCGPVSYTHLRWRWAWWTRWRQWEMCIRDR